MTALLYAAPYEQEMLHLSRVILQDRNSPMHLKSPALAVLECSDAPDDIARCKDARTDLQVMETRRLTDEELAEIFPPLKSQAEIDAEELDRFHGYWQSAAAMIVGVLAGVAIIAWVLP